MFLLICQQVKSSTNIDYTSISALIISIIALLYTIRTYFLKKGLKIRSNLTPCSSRECQDKYIAHLTLENLKDKAAVIFKIYLKMGHNYYLELEDHSEKPLIIGPFEVYQKNYDPIIYYATNNARINIDEFVYDDKYKKQIILSTTEGMYKVKSYIKRWDPIINFFRNYVTTIIDPIRMYHNGKAYGGNVEYLVDLLYEDGSNHVIPFYKGDERLAKYSKWNLTEEDLMSKENLLKLFTRLKENNIIAYSKINIIEFRAECIKRYELDKKRTIKAKYYDYFTYKIKGKIYTIIKNRKMKQANRKHK